MKKTKRESDQEPKRIFGRRMALETSLDELEKNHLEFMKTFTYRYPPDSD